MIINKMDSEDVDSLASDTLPLPHVPSTSLERRRDTAINSGIISIPIDSLLSPKKHCTFWKHGGAQSQLSRRQKSEFELRVMGNDSDIETNSIHNKSRPQTAVNPRVATLSQVGSDMSGRGSPGSLTSLINYFKDKWRSLSSWKQEDEVEMDEVDSLTDSSDYSDHRNSAVNSRSMKRYLDSVQNSDIESEFDGNERQDGMWRQVSKKHIHRPMKKFKKEVNNRKCTFNYYVDPHGSVYMWWMTFMFILYVYNAVSIPLRASFPLTQGTNFTPIGTLQGPPEVQWVGLLVMWILLDLLADALCVLDIILVQSHLTPQELGENHDHNQFKWKYAFLCYITHWSFWVDVLSLLPLELLYSVPVLRFNVLLRLPRLLRIRHVYIFINHFESYTNHPHKFRIVRMSGYLLYAVHIYACIYYSVSAKQGFGVDSWVYNGEGESYLRCFYWALMTLGTIHDLNKRIPNNNVQYALSVFGFLLGVFILAIIIGEITNILEAENLQVNIFRKNQNQVKEYMRMWKIPKEVQYRVQLWYDYAFTQQHMLDENKALDSLPKKMRSDIAKKALLDTLCKVKIFQGFDKSLFRELAPKLRPVIFIPGEYICVKGEIGKEMYIVSHGRVVVLGGANDTEILAELGPGSVFGEISLLAVNGGNRRTAYVRSKHFTHLYVLSKKDLHETLVDYPNAQETLRKKAKFLIHQDKKRQRNRQSVAQSTVAAFKSSERNVQVRRREQSPPPNVPVIEVFEAEVYTHPEETQPVPNAKTVSQCPKSSSPVTLDQPVHRICSTDVGSSPTERKHTGQPTISPQMKSVPFKCADNQLFFPAVDSLSDLEKPKSSLMKTVQFYHKDSLTFLPAVDLSCTVSTPKPRSPLLKSFSAESTDSSSLPPTSPTVLSVQKHQASQLAKLTSTEQPASKVKSMEISSMSGTNAYKSLWPSPSEIRKRSSDHLSKDVTEVADSDAPLTKLPPSLWPKSKKVISKSQTREFVSDSTPIDETFTSNRSTSLWSQAKNLMGSLDLKGQHERRNKMSNTQNWMHTSNIIEEDCV